MRHPLLVPLLAVAVTGGCASAGTSPASDATPHGAGGVATPTLPDPLRPGVDYAVYRGDGTPSSLAELVAAGGEVDVMFVGEEHDDPMTHDLELDLLEQLFTRHHEERGRPIVLSMEMFERDVQHVVDEYLAGLVTEEHFLESARPWATYEEHYRPLVEFARAHELPVVAANAPRRYVNLASRRGRDALVELSRKARSALAPLPYPEPSDEYRAEWDSLMGEEAGHVPETVLDGQVLWDATMAHSLARTLEARPDALVLHLAGGFHVENGTGIPEMLDHYRPRTRVLVAMMVPVDDVDAFDPSGHGGQGDFVILTRATATDPHDPGPGR